MAGLCMCEVFCPHEAHGLYRVLDHVAQEPSYTLGRNIDYCPGRLLSASKDDEKYNECATKLFASLLPIEWNNRSKARWA